MSLSPSPSAGSSRSPLKATSKEPGTTSQRNAARRGAVRSAADIRAEEPTQEATERLKTNPVRSAAKYARRSRRKEATERLKTNPVRSAAEIRAEEPTQEATERLLNNLLPAVDCEPKDRAPVGF